jgi:hypothetical protein
MEGSSLLITSRSIFCLLVHVPKDVHTRIQRKYHSRLVETCSALLFNNLIFIVENVDFDGIELAGMAGNIRAQKLSCGYTKLMSFQKLNSLIYSVFAVVQCNTSKNRQECLNDSFAIQFLADHLAPRGFEKELQR